ncbi:hypothetical protein EJ08DRAFT_693171 [Tothia fuscella]|uniref:Nudix hydrolase domain-containing protein n=1 Tax=Tothia fuscella TaxID=1048955 RepID=A0A9P4P0Y3_9PEZI|nr:hypothetical protein EJ08DRAFT_693171 [Tothia fuscella]
MSDKKAAKAPSIPRPSSSVLLISPTNQVLLLHRVRTSSSFPSAHVFPGGNVSEFHDGRVPDIEDPKRHVDNDAYRLAAIRETFEESGILLAYNNGFGRLLEVEDSKREAGRKAVHKGEVPFPKWLARQGGRPDVDNLIPFTRWITPPNVPKRFTTQMYVYFLPTTTSSVGNIGSAKEAVIPDPTHDGGLEHTAARFLPPQTWLDMAKSGEIIMFPPQVFLLTMISQFLTPSTPNILTDAFEQQRKQLRQFLKGGDPSWADACISPIGTNGAQYGDKRVILSLEDPGLDLKKHGRRGVSDYVVMVAFSKEGPRQVEIRTRKEVFGEGREKL